MARPLPPPHQSPHQKAVAVGLFGGSVAASRQKSPYQKAATKPLPSLAQQTTQSPKPSSILTGNRPFAISCQVADFIRCNHTGASHLSGCLNNHLFEKWCRVFGKWCRVFEKWCRVFEKWCRLFEKWCRVFRKWCRVFEKWCRLWVKANNLSTIPNLKPP